MLDENTGMIFVFRSDRVAKEYERTVKKHLASAGLSDARSSFEPFYRYAEQMDLKE